MILGVFLAIGESFKDYQKKGQESLIIDYLLNNYSSNFTHVYVFSYAAERKIINSNVTILPNKYGINRFIYSLLLPIFYSSVVKNCNVIRCLQLTGGIPGILSKILYRKRFVFNYGYDYKSIAKIEGKFPQFLLYHLIQYPICFFADRIILTSQIMRKELPKLVNKDKLIRIPNGVDTKLFSFTKTSTKVNKILYIGRLEKQKNLESLVYALARLNRYNLTLNLVGDGSRKNDLKKLAKRLHVKMLLTAPVNHNLLTKIFHSAEIFVLPSFIEGQPKVLLEAMSCGLAVVASNISAHSEIIKHKNNGILCLPTPENIALALKLLINNKLLREKIGLNARNSIKEKFSMEALQLKEIKLLKNLGSIHL